MLGAYLLQGDHLKGGVVASSTVGSTVVCRAFAHFLAQRFVQVLAHGYGHCFGLPKVADALKRLSGGCFRSDDQSRCLPP